ncbi:putative G3BP-like protein [Cajanus cajan]|uniref:G3BP-like protein n=1 Tax=Cajanus cajan TaxID=3821 RepID=A0A151U2T3_CAJCA|nr:putative G3BP-like protein [Cajanus cajan]KYP73581.1 Putative G3BP-like protein [Cajanus cajan]
MATPFPIHVTAAQVGTYFVGQYYQVLQSQPEFVHQFYSEASTMLRVDGNARETAVAMLQIHSLIMSLSYTGIEIKTVHSLESWSGGVLVLVSGSVQIKDYNQRRKFMQTFFLAPQEKGYFVLNDVFHFVEEDPVHQVQQQAVLLPQNNLDSKVNASSTINKTVSNYLLSGDIQARDYVAANEVKENGVVDNYGFSEQRMQRGSDSEHIREDNVVEESNGSLQSSMNTVQDHVPASPDEPAGEPQKHTYASILRVAKGQSTPSVASHKNVSPSEWENIQQNSSQQQQTNASANAFERSETDATDEIPAPEDEDEIKSVYVRNLLPTVSPSEIEEEFKNFGRIRPDGVVIRSRKDVGVCYAFVEFEDMTGVHNAVKAGSVQIAGRQVYIEERRPNSNIPSRGGRRGRGRGSYQSDAPRGRFNSRSFGRGSGQDGGDREYNKSKGNGFYRPTPRQERANSGHHQIPRNGQNLTES